MSCVEFLSAGLRLGGDSGANEPHMVGTAAASGTAAPTLPPYASSYQVRFNALASEQLNST
jgi:hypothetical protein